MIDKLESVLQSLADVGIEDIVFTPVDDHSCIVRGANAEQIAVVYHTISMQLFDHEVAIQGANSFLSRLRLFDLDKVKLEYETRDDYISLVRFSQGRRKTSIRMGNPKHMYAPSRVPGLDNLTNHIVLTKVVIDKLLREIASVGLTGKKDEQHITISVTDGELTYSLYNGEDDRFSDKIECDGVSDFTPLVWDMKNFTRVLRKSIDKGGESITISLTPMGAMVFPMGVVNVVTAPIRQ